MASTDHEQVEKMNEPTVMKIQYPWTSRFFFYMSKTDMHVLQFCTPETRMTQASLGIMVVITGALAFISSFFAIHSSFFGRGDSFNDIFIPMLVASFYATAIAFFDREIVAATSKWAAVPRAVLAIFIGIVIAFPIEMKLLEGRIDAQIISMVEANNKGKINEIESLKAKISRETKTSLTPLQNALENLNKDVDKATVRLDEEIKRGNFFGTKSKDRRKELDQAIARSEKNTAKYQQAIARSEKALSERFKGDRKKISSNLKEIKDEKLESHDFLSQAMALHQLVTSNRTAYILSLFLTIFFILLETFPVLIKIFLPYSEYNAYLDARRKLNISRTFTIANYNLELIESDPAHAHERDVEITDVIEKVMEDRLVDVENGRPV